MTRHIITALTIGLFACGGSQPGDATPGTGTAGARDGEAATAKSGRKASDAGEFEVNEAGKSSRPKQAKLQATETKAALRFFVVDKDKGAVSSLSTIAP